MKKKKTQIRKGLLLALLSLSCAFIVAGSAVIIYTHVSNNKNISNKYPDDDDDWTNNY